MAEPEANHTIELDGRRLAWRSLGAGPPLVLVNGYSATAADWDPTLLGALAASFELICPDNRGVGDSQLGDPGELSIDAMANDLILLLDALGIEQASFAGWSMGGFAAQSLAMLAPARVRAMVLLATDPGGPAATLADPDVWARLTDNSGSPREQATRLLAVLFPPEVAVAIDRMFGEVVASARAALSPVALRAQERAIEAWHAREPPEPGPGTPAEPGPDRLSAPGPGTPAEPGPDRLSAPGPGTPAEPGPDRLSAPGPGTPPEPGADRLSAPGAGTPPVLAASGSLDVVIPPSNLKALAARWPGAKTEVFDGGGHAFMAQEPERLAATIVEFLAEVAPKA